MASLAMMLGVQTLHAPFVHVLGCGSGGCHAHSSHQDDSIAEKTAETHVHVHHGHVHIHHGHSHDHAQGEEADAPACEFPAPSHQHSDECQICQFLSQSAQPVAQPVLLTGEEAVQAPPVDILPEVVLVLLSGPYVRGPPLCV